jgi:hypothetical protein
MSDPIRILPHAESDLSIPSIAAIIARVDDLADTAWRQDDTDSYRQLVRLRDALSRGIRMTWSLGDLLVSSASTLGVVYTVSCGACNCPAWKPCKHLKLAEVLLLMLDTIAETADMACVPPDTDPGEDLPNDIPPTSPGRLPFPPAVFAKIAAARSVRYARL